MITKQRQLFYFVGDKTFPTLLDAQKHDLMLILEKDETVPKDLHPTFTSFMINFSTAIVDILTTTPTSRAKARKTNGGTKKVPKRPKLQPAPVSDV